MSTHYQAVIDSMDELLDGDDHRNNDFTTLVQAVQHANRTDMEPSWLREGVRNAPPPNPTFSFPRRPLPSPRHQEPPRMPWRPSDHAQWRPGNPFDIKPYEQDKTSLIPHYSDDAEHSSDWNTCRHAGYTYNRPPEYFSRDYNAPTHAELHDGWLPDPPELRPPPGLTAPNDYPPGNATLTYPGQHGELVSVPGLNIEVIAERSALLATAFEETRSGPQLNLGTLCPMTAMPLVRYLYSGSYADSDVWEDVPTSLLLHCKMHHLGNIYDLPELKTQAYVNILRQCEFGCSSPNKPIDLCLAIAFAFENLRGIPEVTESILHYCVSCFLSHSLGKDLEFTSMAYNIRPFHQDLMKVCRDRGYDDDSAVAIIQMPYKPFLPETYASTEHPAIAHFEDLIYHFHGGDEKKEPPVSPAKRLRVMNPTEPTFKTEAGPSIHKKDEMLASPKKKVRVVNPDGTDPFAQCRQVDQAEHIPLGKGKGVATQWYPSRPKSYTTVTLASFHNPLPVRTRTPASQADVEDASSASEDDGLCISKKCKVPTAAEVRNRSLLSGGESDFELVSGPESVKSVSEDSGDDSDTGTLVDVPRAGSENKKAKFGESKLASSKSQGVDTSADAADASSESEWDMV